MQRNPQYEAGFIRAVDHEEPEDLVMAEERRARVRKTVTVGALVLAVAVALGAFVMTTGNDSASEHLERGRQLIAADAHQAAIVELKRSLLAAPDQPTVHFLLGQEYAALGDPKAAEIAFGKALALGDDPDRTLPLLVASVARQERFEKVVELVDGAKLRSPQANADLQALLGTAYLALGRDAEAHAAWKAVGTYVPAHPGALLAEAKALVANGDADAASALLARIPATAPRQDEVQVLRGDIARARGQWADSAAAYEAALALDPANLPLRANLAQTDVDLGRLDEARAQVDRILVASPDHPKATFIAAEVAIGQNDYRAANEAITRSLQASPRDGRAHLLAGTIAGAMGRPDDAEFHLREAVALTPKDAAARRALAMFFVQKHEAARADEAIGPLFAATPDDPRVAEIVARIALLQGDATRAAKAYDQVDASRADRVDASLRAASLKFAAGDATGGLARLRAAGVADPAATDVDAALVAAFLQLRQPKDAVAAWNAMARKQPDAARTHEVRSTVDLALGDRNAARRSLDKAVALDPNGFAAVARLAQLDVDDHRVDDARSRLRSFIAAHPGHFDATMRLIAIERASGGRDDEMLALLRDARQADPRSPRVVQALAAYELDHGGAQQALRTADEGLVFAPGDPALLATAGDAALASGNPKRAATIFKTLTAMNTDAVDAPIRLGAAWLAAGDAEAALAAFRLVLVRRPDSIEVQRALIGRLLAADRSDEASRLLFEMARLAPRSPALPELDADVKLARRQYPEAIAAYRRALELAPSPELIVRTSESLAKARQTNEAKALLAGWLKAHPADESVRRADAELQRRLVSGDAQRVGSQAPSLPDTAGPLRNASMQTLPGS